MRLSKTFQVCLKSHRKELLAKIPNVVVLSSFSLKKFLFWNFCQKFLKISSFCVCGAKIFEKKVPGMPQKFLEGTFSENAQLRSSKFQMFQVPPPPAPRVERRA